MTNTDGPNLTEEEQKRSMGNLPPGMQDHIFDHTGIPFEGPHIVELLQMIAHDSSPNVERYTEAVKAVAEESDEVKQDAAIEQLGAWMGHMQAQVESLARVLQLVIQGRVHFHDHPTHDHDHQHDAEETSEAPE